MEWSGTERNFCPRCRGTQKFHSALFLNSECYNFGCVPPPVSSDPESTVAVITDSRAGNVPRL